MKKYYFILILCFLVFHSAFAQKSGVCINGANVVGRPSVKIKTGAHVLVDVPILNGSWNCDYPTGIYGGKKGTTREGAAGNCFAYAFYIYHGGPYYGEYKFVLGGIPDLEILSDCTEKSTTNFADFRKVLDDNFIEVAYSDAVGTVVVWWVKLKDPFISDPWSTPLHGAVFIGANRLAQVPGFGAPYEEKDFNTEDAIRSQVDPSRDYTIQKRYFVNTASYPAYSSAGVFTKCNTMKYCGYVGEVITGNPVFCEKNAVTFSVPSGFSSYSWTLDGTNLYAVSGTTGNSLTINTNPNIFQNDLRTNPTKPSWIKVKYTNGGYCEKELTHNLTIKGKTNPAAITVLANPASFSPYQTVVFSRSSHVGITGYAWSVSGASDWIIQSGQGTNNLSVRTGALSAYVRVALQDHCGTFEDGAHFINRNYSGMRAMAEENSELEQTFISFTQDEGVVNISAAETTNLDMAIYDLSGRRVAQPFNSRNLNKGINKLDFDARSLSTNHLYIYKIRVGMRIITGKVIKN